MTSLCTFICGLLVLNLMRENVLDLLKNIHLIVSILDVVFKEVFLDFWMFGTPIL
jgi:hypothetical protein